MLSIKPIGGTLAEVNYYAHLGEAENHDYYSEDGVRLGHWWGAGAAALGLTGAVNPNEFQNILEGLSPDGKKQLVQKREGKKLARRAGFDLTWSLPKSLSCYWSIADHQVRAELDRVAELALDKALEAFQTFCGLTRRGKDGHRQEQAKLVAAVFSHDTARGLPGETPDPNRHFHAVVANVVVREDGSTGALDARPLFQRRMKMALGALFRAELSMLMQSELGLTTYRPQHEQKEELASWWEIEGVPTDFMKAMSKRRAEIETWLRRHGLSGAKAAEKAALRTRNTKEQHRWPELQQAWLALGREFGFTPEAARQLLTAKLSLDASGRQEQADAAVSTGLENLIQRKARFTENELLEQTAIAAQTRGIGIEDILRSVQHQLEHSAEIVPLKHEGITRTFTTRSMLEAEQRMLHTACRLHIRSDHAVALAAVHKTVKRFALLNVGQKAAIRHMATGADIVAVTGVAGSGKTFMLSVASEIFEQAGFTMLGTSLAAKAAHGLETDAGIRSLHLHKLFHELAQGQLTIDEKTILVVDEAGMVGTLHLERLTHLIEARGAKLVLVGDHRQLQAIDAGAPFRAIGEQIGTAELTTIVRQKEAWAREAVLDLRDGRAEQVLEQLDRRGQLHICEEKSAALKQLASDWRELVLHRGAPLKETMVFAGMNVDVRELNQRIQDVMLAVGQLGEFFVELDGLEIRLGDRIKVTKNHSLLHLRNGALGEVTGVWENHLSVRLDEGFEVTINTAEFSHLTLGYAMSLHAGQGVTCEHSLVFTDNVMTDREFSYVAGSRARGKTHFYTDELSIGGIAELAARMNQSRPKEMATEHRLELQ